MLQARQFSLAFLFLEILWIAVFAWCLRIFLMLPRGHGHFACLLAVLGITALGTFFGGFQKNMAGGAKAGYMVALLLVMVASIVRAAWLN
jgi:hypothetical protein